MGLQNEPWSRWRTQQALRERPWASFKGTRQDTATRGQLSPLATHKTVDVVVVIAIAVADVALFTLWNTYMAHALGQLLELSIHQHPVSLRPPSAGRRLS
eukprot:COSAG01_NODE_4689_length_4810_cov_2.969221_3_plen_100_part_00